jgi:hypothetical protein
MPGGKLDGFPVTVVVVAVLSLFNLRRQGAALISSCAGAQRKSHTYVRCRKQASALSASCVTRLRESGKARLASLLQHRLEVVSMWRAHRG